jgi:hypothetical protein
MIVLDSGHHHKLTDENGYEIGGFDPGCAFGEHKEAVIAENIKNKLAVKCSRLGLKYFIPCYYYNTEDRLKQALPYKPQYYLCIHINSVENSTANGVEAIYNDKGRQFANDLVYDLHVGMDLSNRKAYHYYNNKRSPAMFDISGSLPMVLLELGFLSNAKDRAKLVLNQDAFVDVIFHTIAKLFKIDYTVFTLGSTVAQKADKTIQIPAPVIQQNGRTYFPLRTLEAIDSSNVVGWLPNQKKAVLYKK